MAATYSATLATAKDRVRFTIGDTDTTDPFLDDNEIAAYLPGSGTTLAQGTETGAAVALCYAIAAKLRRQVDISEGSMSAKLSQAADGYLKLAERLLSSPEALAVSAATGVLPTESDGTISGPAFTRKLGDADGAGDWPVTT